MIERRQQAVGRASYGAVYFRAGAGHRVYHEEAHGFNVFYTIYALHERRYLGVVQPATPGPTLTIRPAIDGVDKSVQFPGDGVIQCLFIGALTSRHVYLYRHEAIRRRIQLHFGGDDAALVEEDHDLLQGTLAQAQAQVAVWESWCGHSPARAVP